MAQFGKVNLYAPNTGVRHFVFDSLFRGMPWSTDGKYSDLSSTTGTITDSDALADKLGTAVNNKLYRRSDIYQTSSGSFWELLEKSPVNGSVLKTDALQEQLIGRFIGLTTANAVPDSATVIVLAQSIKDLGGGGTVYCDWEGNGTLTGTASSDSAKLKAGYYFYPGNSDTITNPGFFSVPANLNREITVKFGRYDVGADRITGETRLVGRLLYDQGSGKWKIIQVKYDED